MSIKQVAIIGVGLMGGSLGLALKDKSDAPEIIGIGRNPDRLNDAIQRKAIDVAVTDISEGVTSADLIVLCSTISHILQILPTVLKSAKSDAVITDVGSTKSAIVNAANNDSRFIGGHPMAGSEKTGVGAAISTLYNGATWAITPTNTTKPNAVDALLSIIQTVGANPLVLTPMEHDEMVSAISHLPHVIAASYMRFTELSRREHPDLPRMTAGSFADMTRIAAASPSIWRDICLTNRDAVLKSLASFEDEISQIKNAILSNDGIALEEFFTASEQAKLRWP